MKVNTKKYFNSLIKCLTFKSTMLLLSRNYSRLNNMFGNEKRSFIDEYKYFSRHRIKFYNEIHKKIKNPLLDEEIEESSSDEEDENLVNININKNFDSFFLEYLDIDSDSDEEIEETYEYEDNESLIDEVTLAEILFTKEEGEEEFNENDLTVKKLDSDLDLAINEVTEFLNELDESEDEGEELDEISNPYAFYQLNPKKHKDILIKTYTKAILDKSIYNNEREPIVYDLIKEIPFEPENIYLTKYLTNNLKIKDIENFDMLFNKFYFKHMSIFGIEGEDKSFKVDLPFYEKLLMFKKDNQLILYKDEDYFTPQFLISLINLKFNFIIETDEDVYDFYEIPYDFYDQLNNDLLQREKIEIAKNSIKFSEYEFDSDYSVFIFKSLLDYGLKNNLYCNNLLKKLYNFLLKKKPVKKILKKKKLQYKVFNIDYVQTKVYNLKKKKKPLNLLNIREILNEDEIEEILVDDYDIKENFYFHYSLSFELFNFINILFFLENPDFNLNNFLTINLKENKQILYLISELYLIENFPSDEAEDFEEFLNIITSNPLEFLDYIYSFLSFEMEFFKQYLLYFRKHFYYILKHLKNFKYSLLRNTYYYNLIDYRIKSNIIKFKEDLTILKMFMFEVYINPLEKELKNYNEKIYEVRDNMSDMLFFNPDREQYDLNYVFQYKHKVVLLTSYKLKKFELAKTVSVEVFKSKWNYSIEYCKLYFLTIFKNMKNIARRSEMFSDFILILINYLKENDLVKYYNDLYKKEIEKQHDVEEILNQIKSQDNFYLKKLEEEEKRLAQIKEDRKKFELKKKESPKKKEYKMEEEEELNFLETNEEEDSSNGISD